MQRLVGKWMYAVIRIGLPTLSCPLADGLESGEDSLDRTGIWRGKFG